MPADFASQGQHRYQGSKYTSQTSKKVHTLDNAQGCIWPPAGLSLTGTPLLLPQVMKLWAEKEFEVLGRMYSAGIPCPKPLAVHCGNTLLMSFLGCEGNPAPTLAVRTSLWTTHR